MQQLTPTQALDVLIQVANQGKFTLQDGVLVGNSIVKLTAIVKEYEAGLPQEETTVKKLTPKK